MKSFFIWIWVALKTIWSWLVYSSVNADKISMTLKGLAVGLIPVIIVVFSLYNVQLESVKLNGIVDSLSDIVFAVSALVSAISVTWGAFRKLWTTVHGTNAVLNRG